MVGKNGVSDVKGGESSVLVFFEFGFELGLEGWRRRRK